MIKKITHGALVLIFSFCSFASSASALTAPPGFQVNTIASGLFLPTSFVFAPDGRIFVAEKGGSVRVIKNGQLLAEPLLTLPDINDFGDRGLESIALDPNFSQNGYIYLAYTYENAPGQNYAGPKTGRIVRFTVVGDTADFQSRFVILGTVGGDLAHPSCNDFLSTADCILSNSSTHSMGDLHFGPDGKLYATLGDGAGYDSVDPTALSSLDLDNLAGKIVRINPDGTGPSDNPFYTGNPNDNRSKVWSIGHRNSYRFNFRPSDGKIFFGEVGWTQWEEINIGVPGGNYGWPCREGFDATAYECETQGALDPLAVFDHSTGSASIIGGVFPTQFPGEYNGNYFFGDYSNDLIKRMVLAPNDAVSIVENFVTDAGGPVNFVVGPDGSVYYAAINIGEIRNLVFSDANRPPVAKATVNPTAGTAPLTVHFSSEETYDPDGDSVSYLWNFGDGTPFSAEENPDHVYNGFGTHTAKLTVTDSSGLSSDAYVQVSVTHTNAEDPAPRVVDVSGEPSVNVIGRDVIIAATIANDGAPTAFVVDLEIYRKNGEKVAQKVYESATVPTGGTQDFPLAWFPGAIGEYVVKVGLFKAGWAGLYEWQDQALNLTIHERTPEAVAPASFLHQSTTVSAVHASAGTPVRITTSIKNTGGTGRALVDMELYSASGKVGQIFFDNELFGTGETRQFVYDWVVPADGEYYISVGLFEPGWAAISSWHDHVASISPGENASAPLVVYSDRLASGWEDWSWGTTRNMFDEGTLSVLYGSLWGGLYLHKSVSMEGRSSLLFEIAGKGGGGQNLQLYMYDAAGNQLPVQNLSRYLDGPIAEGVWKNVRIPLSDLGAAGRSIQGLVLQDVSGTVGSAVKLKNMRIE